MPGAERTVQMVYRSAFPHKPLIEEIAGVIRDVLPTSVTAWEKLRPAI